MMSCLLKADPGSGAFSSPSCWSSCSTTPSVVLQSLGYSVPVPVLLLASCSALLRQHLSWEKDYVLILPEIPPDLVGLFTRFLWGHQISGISLAQVVQIKELCHLLQISSQFHVDVVKPIPKIPVPVSTTVETTKDEKSPPRTKSKKWLLCKECPTWFHRQKNYQDHIKLHEKDELSCQFCHKVFSRPSLRRHHEKLHQLPFKCEVCPKAFGRLSSLQGHMNTHNDVKPFICDSCAKCFSTATGLATHKKQSHLLKALSLCCSVCGKGFSSNSELLRHNRSHSKDRPFVCHRCGRGFKTRKTLLCHDRVHDEDSIFPCSVCPKTYRWKAALIRHEKEHQNSTSIACNECHNFFKSEKQLLEHALFKHKSFLTKNADVSHSDEERRATKKIERDTGQETEN